MVARGWEKENWGMTSIGYGVPLRGFENVLKLYSADGFIIL